MTLLPEVQRFLESFTDPAPRLTVKEMRERQRIRLQLITVKPQVQAVEDRMIPGPGGDLPIRIYTPEGTGPYPILMYFHGGGFVMGSLDSHDVICRQITRASGCKVVAVEFRLAPEHPFPAAPEDCYRATEWVAAHMQNLQGKPEELGVAGDSSGGAVAASVSIMARDRKGPSIARQVLLFPNTDFHQTTTEDTYPSYLEYGEGYVLTSESLCQFWADYIPQARDEASPYAVPIRVGDFRGLPRTLLITAEYDPLRDEGESYAACLRDAGVSVMQQRFNGIVHGYITPQIYDLIGEFLRSECP